MAQWMRNESELDDFQHQISTMTIDKSMAVIGCAGSGKSIIALHKAKQIAAVGGEYYVIVYTKALRKFIEDGIRTLDLDPGRVVYENQWTGQGSPSTQYIIVDEAQDFTRNQIGVFLSKHSKSISFFGDSAQQLYDNRMQMNDIIGMDKKLSVQKLEWNYRLPKKVARVAEYLLAEDHNDTNFVNRCRLEGEQKPQIYQFSDSDAQLDYIIKSINEKKLTDVGILIPTNKLVDKVKTYLESKGLTPEVKLRNRNTPNANDDEITLDFTSQNPKILTYHSAKGLQFNDVFLPFCESATIDHPRTPDFYQKPLYVAFTRTLNNLYVLYADKLSAYFDDVPKDLYLTQDSEGNVDF